MKSRAEYIVQPGFSLPLLDYEPWTTARLFSTAFTPSTVAAIWVALAVGVR